MDIAWAAVGQGAYVGPGRVAGAEEEVGRNTAAGGPGIQGSCEPSGLTVTVTRAPQGPVLLMGWPLRGARGKGRCPLLIQMLGHLSPWHSRCFANALSRDLLSISLRRVHHCLPPAPLLEVTVELVPGGPEGQRSVPPGLADFTRKPRCLMLQLLQSQGILKNFWGIKFPTSLCKVAPGLLGDAG